jgi:hypothetical protein
MTTFTRENSQQKNEIAKIIFSPWLRKRLSISMKAPIAQQKCTNNITESRPQPLLLLGRTVQGDYSGFKGNFFLRLGVKIYEAMVNTDAT